jgi:hypothetical protein
VNRRARERRRDDNQEAAKAATKAVKPFVAAFAFSGSS